MTKLSHNRGLQSINTVVCWDCEGKQGKIAKGNTIMAISTAEAKFIAQDWHGGQYTAFYAFASSGSFDKFGMLSEVRGELEYATANDDLLDLLEYCENQPDPMFCVHCNGDGCDHCDFSGYGEVYTYPED